MRAHQRLKHCKVLNIIIRFVIFSNSSPSPPLPPSSPLSLSLLKIANSEVKISRLAKGIRKIGGIKHPKLKNVTKGWKRKKKQVKFSRNFKGKVIDGVHELYTLTAGMMLGMRCAVSFSIFSLSDLCLIDWSFESNGIAILNFRRLQLC